MNSLVEFQRLALLVDGDPETRRLHGAILQTSAYAIEEAADGRVALAKAIARQPDIIVTEIRLPGISGIDLCRLLRDDSQTRDVPLIFVTDEDDDAAIRRAKVAGAATVLAKPCERELLMLAVQQAIEHSQHLHERLLMLRHDVNRQLRRSDDLLAAQVASTPKISSRSFQRHETTMPPSAPPAIFCPQCDATLRYLKSYIGGVNERHREQWDVYECTHSCGTFQYRQRTRKLRRTG